MAKAKVKEEKPALDIERLFTIAVGAWTLTKEKAEEIIEELEEKGEVKKKDAKKYVDELVKKGEKEREELRTTIDDRIREVTKKLGIVTQDDIKKLNEKLERLERKLR